MTAQNTSTGTGSGSGVSGGVVTSGSANVNGRYISWTQIGYGTYYIYHDGNTYPAATTTGNYYTAPTGVSRVEVKWQAPGTATMQSICSVSFYNSGASTSAVYVQPGTRTVIWSNINGATFNVYANGQLVMPNTTLTSYTAPTGVYSVRVDYILNGVTATYGSVSLPVSGNASGSTGNTGNNTNHFTAGSLTITKGNTYSVVTWPATGNAQYYLVNYKNLTTNEGDQKLVTATTIQVPYGYNDTWSISVSNFSTGQSIGATTVYPTGSTGVGGTNASVTTNGTNCIVNSTPYSAIVNWTGNGSSYYTVYYTTGSTTKTTTVNTTSVTLPIGHSNDFTVFIADGNQNFIATVNVKQQASSSTGTATPANAQTGF